MNQEEQYKLNKELIEAVNIGQLEKIKYLVENGADIHGFKEASLINALKKGHLDVVKYLVEQGANIHSNNDYSLRVAAENGHLEVVKYLVEKGTDIYANNNEALIWASNNGHIEIVKYFLFDCQMKVKQETKDWLIGNNKKECLYLIEERDLLFKLDKDIIQKDSVDNVLKKIKI